MIPVLAAVRLGHPLSIQPTLFLIRISKIGGEKAGYYLDSLSGWWLTYPSEK
jgi:hypothetical protein